MAKRRESVRSVSLFPFLAVLVCAMGALILLLLVTTRRIRRDAELRAEAELAAVSIAVVEPQLPQQRRTPPATPQPPPPSPPPVSKPVAAPVVPRGPTREERLAALRREHALQQAALDREWNNRIAGLASEQESAAQALAALQSKRESLEREQLALAAELEEAAQRRAQASGRRASLLEELQSLSAQKEAVSEEIDAVAGKLASLQAQQNAQSEDVYTIVPVDGLTGTTRRPIVIECLEDRINLVSEGITLTSADLDGFIPPFNPLAAGVKALGGAWYARDGEDPYVLLIVRPQGTVTFYVARMFLTASRVPFGYELVTADRKLNWPKSDEAVTAACRAAIDDMLRRRNEVPEMSELAGGAGEVVHLRGSDGAFRLAEVEELRQPPGRTVQFGGQRLDRDAFTQGSGEPSEPVEAERGGGGVFRRSSQEEPQAGDRSARPARLPVHPLPQGTGRDRPVSGTAAGGLQRSGERSWMSPLSTGIAVQRDVKIAVEVNQIRVEGERPVRLEGGTTSTEMAEATVDAVDRVIQTWKPAPQGFYWKPRIQFAVSPGAVQRYAALNRAMQTWGIDTSVEYVQPQTASQPVGTGQGTQRR